VEQGRSGISDLSDTTNRSGVPSVIDLRDDRPGVERILELAAPGTDPGWIAGLLNRDGYPAPGHRPWSPEDVLAVLDATGAKPSVS
jgi:hypothetical protein